ncbi:HPr family phosphocarrier protein [Youxingia wuxianensis]|uniref:Phosphocarrier protein HPr n=1 Tax=Youxingia wuxianensis TaxID=2763678 RepID=A0A926IGE2_9FIRM|nr:HPr family phosphocarrier protein [Youxingia wuxianensis]MBC8584774.1 HPr family phosphocarrier protein [Youxingia wuxianensis]
MYSRKTTVINRTGLHARPASQFIDAAKKFTSRIHIRNLSLEEEDNLANAKSIISVLTLAMVQGSEIEIIAEGDDEKEAVDSLIALVDSGFGE